MKITLSPGLRSSEFKVALLSAVLNLLNSSQHWTSWRNAATATAAAVAYVLSRGLAKTEPRGAGGSAP